MWENRLSCEPCACGLGSANTADRDASSCSCFGGLRRCSVERLSGRCAMAWPGLARSQNRVLLFRAHQVLAKPLSQISSHASSLTPWAGSARGPPPACLMDVYSEECRTWLLRQAVWDLGPYIEAACQLIVSAYRQNSTSEFFGDLLTGCFVDCWVWALN